MKYTRKKRQKKTNEFDEALQHDENTMNTIQKKNEIRIFNLNLF